MFGPVSRVAAALKRMRAYDPEREYLNDAGDRIDLERRQREIDRGLFKRRPYQL